MPLVIQMQKGTVPLTAQTTTIRLAGSLDTATAPDLEAQLAGVLDGPVKELVFDMTELTFLSSAGLRVLAAARKQLRKRGGLVSFIHLQPQIKEVFDIIASLPGIAIFNDVEEMDRYLAARQRAHTEHV
jgi:anti-sigma B factor antagonist